MPRAAIIRLWFGWLCSPVQGLQWAGEPPSQEGTNLLDVLEQKEDLTVPLAQNQKVQEKHLQRPREDFL